VAASGPLTAVLDIGTNTVLMLLGRRCDDGSVEVERDDAIVTGLGRGRGPDGRLAPAAIARTLGAIEEHLGVARRAGAERVLAVATEGVRMATAPEEFLTPAATVLGSPIRLLSGDEEARLSYLSVAAQAPAGLPLRVVDIGGGSTELVTGHGCDVVSAVSHLVGSVRWTERFPAADPPGLAALQGMIDAAARVFAAQPLAPAPELHGLAGTVTTAAALLLGLDAYDRDRVDGSRHPVAEVEALARTLAQEPLGQRAARPCLPAGRADVIVAGLAILVAVLCHCGAQTLVVRDRGLRFALL
jgi:exopolyphosphatase/guanosine-5'-triphosphate,3'-diphosphate pyrophosphatase